MIEIPGIVAAIGAVCAVHAGTKRDVMAFIDHANLGIPGSEFSPLNRLFLWAIIWIGALLGAIFVFQFAVKNGASTGMAIFYSCVALYVRYFISARRATRTIMALAGTLKSTDI